MSTTVIGLYDSRRNADKAIEALASDGWSKDGVEMLEGDDAAKIGRQLNKIGFEQDADSYARLAAKGAVILAIRVSEEDADEVADVLSRAQALTPEEADRQLEGGAVAQEVEESIRLNKREKQAGVRVVTRVTEQPFRKTVPVREERVKVERRKADRKLKGTEAEAAFEEGEHSFTETSEEVEVAKEARVVGEVEVSKQVEERDVPVEATVRRTHVEVERDDGQDGQHKSGNSGR